MPEQIDPDQVVAAVAPFADKLLPGERLMVTTLVKCPCMIGAIPAMIGPHHVRCHLCNGTGYLREVKSWVGP